MSDEARGFAVCGKIVGSTVVEGAHVTLSCCRFEGHTGGCEWRADGVSRLDGAMVEENGGHKKEPVRALADALVRGTGCCPLCGQFGDPDTVQHLQGCAVNHALVWLAEVEVTLARHVVRDRVSAMVAQACGDRAELLKRLQKASLQARAGNPPGFHDY